MKRIIFFTALAVSGLFVYLSKRYQSAKDRVMQQLHSGSEVIETTYGPVEYTVRGEGTPMLVLHGIVGSYEQGRAHTQMMADQPYQRIMISRPGYSRTPSNGAATPTSQADLCAALLDELDIPEAFIMGISGGGPAAMEFARRYGDRCLGLILMSTPGQSIDLHKIHTTRVVNVLASTHFTDFWAWVLIESVALFQPVLALFNQDVDKRLLKDHEGQAMFAELLRTSFPISVLQAGIDNDVVQFRSLPVKNLDEIDVPTLVIHGTDDVTVAVEHADYLARAIPGAQLVKIDGGEHAFAITHRDEVWPHVLGFLAEPHAESEAVSA